VEKFAYIENCDVPLFGLGGKGYSIRTKDRDFLKSLVEKNKIKNILEFGAGKSTLMFDNLGCNVTSYDTIPFFVNAVKVLGSDRVRAFLWDGKDADIKDRYDLVFIDGPAGGDTREPSYRLASNIKTKYIACHDANRKWETLWAEKYLAGKELVASSPDNVMKVYKNATN